METAIRWSPNSTLSSQRFLFADVSGRSFYLGTVKSYGNSKLEYTRSDVYSNVAPFRALDWAPFDESLVAVGTPSGEAVVLDINETGPQLNFPARYQRPCNAVAFSNQGLLAAGLERVRNDVCLNVWDARAQDSATAVSNTAATRSNFVEPVRKFASSEAVSSIKFFSSQPDIIVVGVKGFGIRCYDLRDATSNPSLQFLTSCVHNIAIDYLNEVHFACAGPLKDTTVQVWDVRSGLPHASSASSTRKGASFASDSDSLAPQEPLIALQDVFNTSSKHDDKETAPANIWSLRYCKGKAGFLGALANNGDFRVFETQKAFTGDDDTPHKGHDHSALDTDQDIAEPILTRRVHRLERRFDDPRHNRGLKERIVSFDFTNLASSKYQPTALVLRGDNSLDILEVPVPYAGLSASTSGDLAVLESSPGSSEAKVENENEHRESMSVGEGIRSYHPMGMNRNIEERKRLAMTIISKRSRQGPEHLVSRDEVHVSSFERHERLLGISRHVQKLSLSEALTIISIARTRCDYGYGLDPIRNVEVVDENCWLQDMWRWIARAKKHADDKTSTVGAMQLSYLGVQQLWNQGLEEANGFKDPGNTRTSLATFMGRPAQNLRLSGSVSADTKFSELRHLCLYTLGFGFNEQQLAGEVIRLARNGKQTKAASLALLLGHHKLAATALKTGKLEPHHRALAIAVAGYVKGSTDDSWNDVVQAVLQDVTDPNARAILALVKRGNWRDVLKEVSLPLKDRIGTALLHLSDSELTAYIDEATSGAITEGDIEGIALTGLTERGVTLFETYIRKFSDLQTAVLALSQVSPRFFRDDRVEKWREEYRSWVDAWQMHAERARFDISLRELSTTSERESRIPVSPAPVTLQCAYCEKSLIRYGDDDSQDGSSTSSPGSGKNTVFGDAKFGTMCPNCGQHLPRCVICERWLGMPDSDLKYGAVEMASMPKAEKEGKMPIVCAQCSHMTHLAHAQAWFQRFSECPQPGCECRCMDLDECS